MKKQKFDIIVVGGGHAGTEAAMASARMGCQTLLLTQKIDMIGSLSCNPAIGGIGKSQLVKEIDALGGIMGKAIDYAGIQFRILNSSRGVAVRSTRVQADRIRYREFILSSLKNQKNLFVQEGEVVDFILKENYVIGVKILYQNELYTRAVILTAGTFLGGKIHVGNTSYDGGRRGDNASILLANNLKRFPFSIKRLKTGTPPRLDLKSINFNVLLRQNGDFPLPFFSFMSNLDKVKPLDQMSCYITYTNQITHDIIKKNIHHSPMYNGFIKSVGPRYCPSIEDKVMRFFDRKRHQIFLEPEGLNSDIIYPNGISTSFPLDIQKKLITSIKGLERAKIIFPGYAIEYDYFDSKDLKLTLESKLINGLFFAGQVNGTTGYEEAAAQGLLAGINAALSVRPCNNYKYWFPRRDQAYLGVLIDDLCNKGTDEPYRMFTARAEYRLSLREDNADERLTPIGDELGLICNNRKFSFEQKMLNIKHEINRLKSIKIYPGSLKSILLKKLLNVSLSKEITAYDLLKWPAITYKLLMLIDDIGPGTEDIKVAEQIEIKSKYSGYLTRQREEINRCLKNEETLLPSSLNYFKIKGLSNEVVTKLNQYKPSSIGQASRISGITPAAISILLIYLKKNF